MSSCFACPLLGSDSIEHACRGRFAAKGKACPASFSQMVALNSHLRHALPERCAMVMPTPGLCASMCSLLMVADCLVVQHPLR